jgi:hypothetical protein
MILFITALHRPLHVRLATPLWSLLPRWRPIGLHALAGGVIDGDAVLLLGAFEIVPRAVRHPGAPCGPPIGELVPLSLVVVLEPLELGEGAPMVPSCFLGGVVGEIVVEVEAIGEESLLPATRPDKRFSFGFLDAAPSGFFRGFIQRVWRAILTGHFDMF